MNIKMMHHKIYFSLKGTLVCYVLCEMCSVTCVYSAVVRDVLIHLASCWIQGTVHSYIKQSGIQHYLETTPSDLF